MKTFKCSNSCQCLKFDISFEKKLKALRGLWEDGEEASGFCSTITNWTGRLCLMYNFRTLEFTEAFQLPRKAASGKLWSFQSISVLNSEATTHPLPFSPLADSCVHVPGAACTPFTEGRVCNKDVVLQISGLCVSIADP